MPALIATQRIAALSKGGGVFASWDFADDRFVTNGVATTYVDLIAERFSRSGVAYFIDDDGVLKQVADGVPRRTQAGSIFVEEGTTNLLPNPSFGSAAVGAIQNSGGPGGSAGTRPTSYSNRGTLVSGSTLYVAAVGTEDGRAYVDFEQQNLSSAIGGTFGLYFGTATQVAFVQNEISTLSLEYKLISMTGSFTGIRFNSVERTAAGAGSGGASPILTPTLDGTRRKLVQTHIISSATTAFLQSGFEFIHGAGAGSIRVRLYLTQLEKKAKRTSWINGTRAGEILSLPDYPTLKNIRLMSHDGTETLQSLVNMSGASIPNNLSDPRVSLVQILPGSAP